MKLYTVLLLYPDYCGNYGEQTYLGLVSAESVEQAQEYAQREVALGYFGEDCQDDIDANFEDWSVLLVVAGHHDNLAWVE